MCYGCGRRGRREEKEKIRMEDRYEIPRSVVGLAMSARLLVIINAVCNSRSAVNDLH